MSESETRKARHVECSLEEYHKRLEYSNSQNEVLLVSPPLFEGTFITKIYPGYQSKALDIGSAAHSLLACPADRRDFLEIPAEALNNDGHKKGAAWKQFEAEHPDTILLKRDEHQAVVQMIKSVYRHPVGKRIMENVLHGEFALVYEDEETGLPLRARPDLIARYGRSVVIADLKTTRAVTLHEFNRDAVKYGYHRQAAWYTEAVLAFGYDVAGFIFITVDKSPAHDCRIYDLPARAIELGIEQIQASRRDLARRLETNDWTDPYGREILTGELPDWAYNDPWRM